MEYLERLSARDLDGATDLLTRAIDDEGVGAMNDALAAVCQSLMDRVTFPAGTVDVHAVLEAIATRVVQVSQDNSRTALDQQRSLIVYLGSEGLPCAARADVATWPAIQRLRALVACTIGLVGVVSDDEGHSPYEVVSTLVPPQPAIAARGTFGLAYRGVAAAEPLAGVVPRGYTANITFLGEGSSSLRSIFARVALLRDTPVDVDEPERQVSESSTH